MRPAEPSMSSLAAAQSAMAPSVETDMTVQAFAKWLTEMKSKNSRTLQDMLSEMSIIRDGITSNNVDLTDFKRHSTGVSQQMQTQLTDLREKLTNAFGEITFLVKQKTSSDQEMMQDINSLTENLSNKTAEIENLKRSYSQAHQHLQSSLIQMTNHLSVTKNEVVTATTTCDRVQQDTSQRLGEIDYNLRGLEEMLSVGNAENRNQMLQLQEEISRIHESLASVSAEFLDHKRATNSVHNKLQSQVWSLEEGRKRQAPLQADSQLSTAVQAPQTVAPRTEDPSASSQPSIVPGVTVPAFASSVPAPATESGAGYTALQQLAQPGGSTQVAERAELINVRGITMPCYSDQNLLALHPTKLREHALLLFRTFGPEAIGSGVPVQDGDLFEWVSRIHKLHVEPLRGTSTYGSYTSRPTVAAPTETLMSASLLPTQQLTQPIVMAPGNVMPSYQQGSMMGGTVTSMMAPGVQTRPSMIMARPPVGMAPQPLR